MRCRDCNDCADCGDQDENKEVMSRDDFYSAIRGIDLYHFGTRYSSLESLVEILQEQDLLPNDFCVREFYDLRIKTEMDQRRKGINVRIALDNAGVKLEDGEKNKLVADIVDRIG